MQIFSVSITQHCLHTSYTAHC